MNCVTDVYTTEIATMRVKKKKHYSSLLNLHVSFTGLLDAGREILIMLDLHSWCRCRWHFISAACFIPRWQMSCITLQGQEGQSFHAALSQCFPRLCMFCRWFCQLSQWNCVYHTDNHHARGTQRRVHTRSLADKTISLSTVAQ